MKNYENQISGQERGGVVPQKNEPGDGKESKKKIQKNDKALLSLSTKLFDTP